MARKPKNTGKAKLKRKRTWITYDPSETFSIPPLPACYVIYLNEKVQYIGQSIDVRKRFQGYNIRPGYGGGYFTPWGQYRDVKAKLRFSAKYGDWAMRELRLIRRLQPPLNCVGSTKRRQLINV